LAKLGMALLLEATALERCDVAVHPHPAQWQYYTELFILYMWPIPNASAPVSGVVP
jgi:hypothetical protein